MQLHLKLRGKLVAVFLALSIIPLIIGMCYVGNRAKAFLEDQSLAYMQARVGGFAMMVQTRYDAIANSIDIIKEQLSQQLRDDVTKLAAKEHYFKSGYLAIFQSDGVCLYHPNAEFVGNKALYTKLPYVRDALEQARQGKTSYEYTFEGQTKLCGLSYNKGLNIIMWGAAPASEVFSQVTALMLQAYIFMIIVSVIVAVLGSWVAIMIASKVKGIATKMQDIAEGQGDLTVRLPVITTDELGDMAHWFNRFMENLERVIIKVKHSSTQVDAATQEVASGAQGLSQTSQEQASAIEEVAATIEEMTSTIKQTAANAEGGRTKARSMVETANKTSEATRQLITAMSEMSQSSKKIGDITVTVNEVAFQTNLLALNAAVEAARAGEHGKGFAVVAEEVRALAQRSADAARQIKVLIEDTVGRITAGDEMVKRSGESIREIITHIEELSQTMEEIAASSAEQASGVDELNRAVSQIDATTQQNASTVEELSSTADNMSTEARALTETVERFKVTDDTPAGPTRHPAPKANARRPAAARPAARPSVSQPKPEIITDNEDFEEF